jgi:FKBP-type peptidyl-prolyl cis-trans isomerase
MRFFAKSSLFQVVVILSTLLFLQSCGDDNSPTNTDPDFSTVPDAYNLSENDTTYVKDGVEIYVIEKGYSEFEVLPRDQIFLKYTGRIFDDGSGKGQIFESTYAGGNEEDALITNLRPIATSQQAPQIEGFRRGLLGMKEGEKRVIIVPPSLGYDDSRIGINGIDLRGKTLRYDVELTGISN